MPISPWFWLLLFGSLLASFSDLKTSAAVFASAAAIIGYLHSRR